MEIIIKIDGMSCNHCTSAVHKALSETVGVESVDVSLENKCAKVVFNGALITEEELCNVIEEQGFDVIK